MKIEKVRIWIKTNDHSDLPELIKKVKKEIALPSIRSLDYWGGLILYTVRECDHPNNEKKFSSLEKSWKATLEMA